MPRMLTKIEGRGNGMQTNVVHMVDIAKSIGQLGAQSEFDEKTGIALVTGAHENAKLAGLLDKFIKKFASLTAFIMKNPPVQKKGGKDENKAMGRAEKERLKEGEAADDNVAHEEEEEDVQWVTDTSLEAARKCIQEQLSSRLERKSLNLLQRKLQLLLMVAANDEPEAKSSTVTENGKSAGIGAQKQLVEKIQRNLKVCSSNSPQDVMNALIDALFGGVVHNGFSKEVLKKKKNYLAAATHDNEGWQILLLRAIDALCEKSGPEVVTCEGGSIILLLVEEYIVQWFNGGTVASGRQIWKNVKPFIA
ncbi:hypothetical protein MKW92_034765 [Papaver armeniacum]|nr:hypothetical protein MKW92_034765 [Papaver armeniacum]